MAMTVHVDVVSTEQMLFSGIAEFVVVPAEMGEIGIYPHHAPLITRMKPGSVRIKSPDKTVEEVIYVSGGVLEIQPGVVTILSDMAVRGEDLDESLALAAKSRAEAVMRTHHGTMDFAKAQVELAEAVAQIQTIERLRKRSH
ncbi:MAG: F0F1 ATP synthase subunit epsilon [Proteobacteria bacterium]|nr:F0F1 ATP synthase subunit epsilon [Pseudomonadota bacterium]MDE3208646.1 F0F1 ATP synthase subunit epsilon [Pseudomonadota bacterium]